MLSWLSESNFEILRTIDADKIHFTAAALETLLGL